MKYVVSLLIVSIAVAGVVHPQLRERLDELEEGGSLQVIVHMKNQSDLSTLPKGSSKLQKLSYLEEYAVSDQAQLLDYLEKLDRDITQFKSYWIFNGVTFMATEEIIIEVAARNDVDYVIDDFIIHMNDTKMGANEVKETMTPEWNITKVSAPQCWSAGYDGSGIIVGNMDTGVDVDHPALAGKWISGGWYDAVNGSSLPYDDHGHGTHTMGIICGGDGNGPFVKDIGVAPGAMFIAAKMLDENNSGYASWAHDCFQWFATQNAQVVCNSWSSGSSTSIEFWNDCMNWRNLGIYPVFATGNQGPGAGSARIPGNYPIVTGVGGTDSDDNMYYNSGRGPAPDQNPWNDPSYWERPDWNLTKPDITAPGVSVSSSIPGGGYASWSGTSMACPHVTGAVAICLEQTPSLDYNTLYNLLLESTDEPSQGAPYPNYNYGWGRLNCFAALNLGIITVVTPNGEECWMRGNTYDITWTSSGVSGNVKIELFKGGAYHRTVSSSTSNDGLYSWAISVSEIPGTDYRIKISSVSEPAVHDFSDEDFSICRQIRVLSPNGEEVWYVGENHDIIWVTSGIGGNVKIEYSIDGGSIWSTIRSSTSDDGSYTWQIPNTPTTQGLVKVSHRTCTSNYDQSDNNFTIAEQQYITVTTPNGGECWIGGNIYEITWTSSGVSGNANVELYKDASYHSTIASNTPNDGSHYWSIPVGQTPGTDFKVKISSVNEPSIYDFSDNNFSTCRQIEVTSPNGGETWYVGSSHDITWVTSGIGGNVKIEYSTDGGSSWSMTSSSTADDSTYSWTIPDDTTHRARVKISHLDCGSNYDQSDNDFTIAEQGSVVVISPNGGECWIRGNTCDITWSSTGVSGNIRIDLYKGGIYQYPIVDTTANVGVYGWHIPLGQTPGTDYTIKISSVNDPAIYDFSDDDFSICRQIQLLSPNGGEVWYVGEYHDIIWITSGINGNVKIEYSTDGGSSWNTVASSTSDDGEYTWPIPNEPTIEALVRVSHQICSANHDQSDSNFTIAAGEITVVYPNGGCVISGYHNITWTSSGVIGSVRIDMFKDDVYYFTIVTNTPNDGLYNWSFIEPGTDFKIRISSTSDSSIYDYSDSSFAVCDQIAITSPNGGEYFYQNTVCTVDWSTSGIDGDVMIEFSTDNGANWDTVISSTVDDGSYSFTLLYPPTTQAGVKVSHLQCPCNYDQSDNNFTIMQHIEITSPSCNDTICHGDTLDIEWITSGIDVSMNQKSGTICSADDAIALQSATNPTHFEDPRAAMVRNQRTDGVRIEYSVTGGATWEVITPSTPDNGIYQWVVPSFEGQMGLKISLNVYPSNCDTVFFYATGAEEMKAASLPNSYSLSVFPVPASRKVRIQYRIPATATVTAAIYDVGGKLVKRLTSCSQIAAGDYEYAWDACNANGRKIADGVYFVRFEAGDYTDTKKIILLR